MTTDVAAVSNQTPTSNAQSKDKTTALTSDFETFLKMLTAQARYQDPLEPIDSTEYAAQLAQFSMVEQQVLTNDVLAALHADIGMSNMSAMASWVGMEARAAVSAEFDGAPVTVMPRPEGTADRAELVVYNAEGAEIDRIQIPVSQEPVQWDGDAAGGAKHPWGDYTFFVESFSDGSIVASDQAEIYAKVTEAQMQDGQVVLIFAGGQRVAASQVTGLR